MFQVSSINADFKLSPFFYARVFIASLIEILRTTMPSIDWQANRTHHAVDFVPQGLLSLPWATTDAQWLVIMLAQARPVPRRLRGIEFPAELGWGIAATDLEKSRNKADVKHQTTLTDRLPEVKKQILDLALLESPPDFVSVFRQLPIADQTILRLMTDIETQYYEVPHDQILIMQEQMNEAWVATMDPRVFTHRLLSLRNAMSPTYQAVYGPVVLNQLLIDALRHHPTLQQHVLEEFHRSRPNDYENFPYEDAAKIWVRFILMDKNNSTAHAAVAQAPVQGPVQDPSVNSTIGELTAAVHSLQATVHAMNTTSQFQGRGGRGMQGRNYQAPQGRGNQGRAQQGRAGTQGRGQGRAQGRGRGGNAGGLFCFWHHYNSTHSTVDCYYCNMYYPPVSFPNVYTITRPGQVNAPGGVILVSGGGSNN
jgi:hypothetical protein